MDEETYDTFKPTSVKPTVREYKVKILQLASIDDLCFGFQRIHKLGKFNPEFQKKAQADWEQKEKDDAEAKERFVNFYFSRFIMRHTQVNFSLILV